MTNAALACAIARTNRFPKEAILNATHNQTIQHQSKTPTDNDVQKPASQAGSATPRLQNVQTSQQPLLHDFQKVPVPFEKPHAPVGPRYAPPNGATRSPEKSTPESRFEDAALAATRSHQALHRKSATESAFAQMPDGNSNSNEKEEAASSPWITSKINEPAERKNEQDNKTEKHHSLDEKVSEAIRTSDFENAKKLLKHGAKPSDDAIQDQLGEAGDMLYWLAASQDIETLHCLVAYTTPEIKKNVMETMACYASRHKSPILMEYVARHSVMDKSCMGDAPLDKSNGLCQALIDGGVAFGEDCALHAAIREAFPFSYDVHLASLPNRRNTAAQAFDAHRDGKYQEADTLFNAPVPTKENPLGLTENMRSKFSEYGLGFAYQRLRSNHGGLISTMPDLLLNDGFRSEIVSILRSCQKECKATREALTRQMSTSGLKLAYKNDAGNTGPCNDRELEQLLFAFQLMTHERLIQIARPPLKGGEEGYIFKTIKSGIFSFLNLDKDMKARTAQADRLIYLAKEAPQITLQLPQEILEIKKSILDKRMSVQTASELIQNHQETLEEKFQESMSGALPGTPLSEQVIVRIYGEAFKELSAIKEEALANAAALQTQ
jgi:hypothetical protein